MKTAPITPGRLAWTAEGLPHSPEYGDIYHPAAGALLQARHVFLAGNGLPQRWAGRERFVILETGFGLGNNFLATWDAWRGDAQRCERLVFVSIEKHPLVRDDLARAHADSALQPLARQLVDAWPLATPNLHALAFERGQVQLLLGFGDVELLLPQIMANVDAYYLDGFAPARNPAMWSPRVLQRMGRLAAPGATAATWSAARASRDGLAAAGFEVRAALGVGGKRDITLARHAPRHRPAAPPGGLHEHAGPREALIVGAGLAGCAAAWALAQQGWHCRVLDREDEVARAASGNPAGLWHGSFHADDGRHARLHRAAALHAQRQLQPWIAAGSVRGQAEGLLRLDAHGDPARAQAALAAQALPPEYVQWLDRDAACNATGLTLPGGGYWYRGGGWAAPRDLATALLADSGAAFQGGVQVDRIERERGFWHALDAQGQSLVSAPVLVLANALDARRLLGQPFEALAAVRGQISDMACDAAARLPRTRVPVAGAGYLLPPIDGRLLFGASSARDDLDASLRESDHHHNLAQLARLAGAGDCHAWTALPWSGRVGWRAVTPDRLPLIGAVPDMAALTTASRADQPRFVPRHRDAQGGLYVYAGLGSRGIGWAALGGQLLASWISGAPCPVEADLRDALDPARYALRCPRD